MKTYSADNYESAPIEYFHGKIMDYFHEFRTEFESRNEKYTNQKDGCFCEINGSMLNNIIAKAKNDTLNKYHKLNISEPVLKSSLL